MYRRPLVLACAGLLATACFGKFALGVTQTIEPNPILPGASVKQEVNVEADGLLGTAVKQAMTDAAAKGQTQGQTGTQWQVRDNSDGAAIHLRMYRSVSVTEAQTAVPQSSTGGFDVGTISVKADDWLLARRYAVAPYVGAELADVYAAAVLVVSRAGAGTVNECCQLGLPALYIPLPGARGDEQAANARLVERTGGAAVLPQSDLTPERLVAEVTALLADPRRLKEMGERARRIAVPDATERLVALLTEHS